MNARRARLFNVATLVRVTSNGKPQPPTWPKTPPEVSQRLRDLEHDLRCRQHLSFRQVQAAMLERYGERRSLGQLHLDLTRFECDRCSTAPRPAPPPDPAQRPRTYSWR